MGTGLGSDDGGGWLSAQLPMNMRSVLLSLIFIEDAVQNVSMTFRYLFSCLVSEPRNRAVSSAYCLILTVLPGKYS